MPLIYCGIKSIGSRTIQRNSGNYIFQTLWFQFLHEVFHTGTFQLEHPISTVPFPENQEPFCHHNQCAAYPVSHRYPVPPGVTAFWITVRVRSPRKSIFRSPSSSRVVMVNWVTIEPSCALERGTYSDTVFLTDHHTCRMHGCMARKPFQTLCRIDQLMNLRLFFVNFFQFRIHM